MGKYWIRNRGRTEGPFDAEKIQGLMRRGRFNRHYQVSEDKKSWYPASDFPELLVSAPGRGRGDDDDDDDIGGSRGGSIFENNDDDAPAPKRSRASRPAPAAKGRSPFGNPDDDDDDDDRPRVSNRAADDDDDDEEDWQDENSEGFVYRLAGWVESQWRGIAGVLLMVLLGLGWYVFGREDWSADQADMDKLIAVHSSITAKHAEGNSSNDWERLGEETKQELADMVSRLEKTASSKDHVKQQLLFTARDEIPRMFKELPIGNEDSSKRILRSFNLINDMIANKTRQHQESIVVSQPVVEPPAQLDPSTNFEPSPDPAAPAAPTAPASENPSKD